MALLRKGAQHQTQQWETILNHLLNFLTSSGGKYVNLTSITVEGEEKKISTVYELRGSSLKTIHALLHI